MPMFSALDGQALDDLARQCRLLRPGEGQIIFIAGQPAEAFYVVLGGRVKIYKLSPRGDEQILHLYGPGDSFGEAAMWAGRTYPANAQTLSQAVLLEVRKDVLRRVIAQQTDLALGMLAGLSAKLREFTDLIEELSLKEVPARLAGVLLKLAGPAEPARPTSGRGRPARGATPPAQVVHLRQTKRQLAAQIGTVAETLSRALARMKSAGLIDVQGSDIRLLDRQGLEKLAEGETVL
ncbi:MAG: cAMP receptor protein [Planctomycetes bacterium ADurb.Bin126]|nr:MAG: cAMP receptor protein [Planctomycetes bacterium ADurb.Bin126]HOD83502.1 Crp/Fnr family transcriptional regulator [Phycisphaerae bacterium]HQL75269.1 Crp/Fnr family transcriptional regulator [Phycisphaerae bacterium]